MKKVWIFLNKPVNFFILILLTGSLMLQMSCQDDDPEPPKITNIRLLDPDYANESLASAPLGTWIVIQGENLSSAMYVYFNGYQAEFNPTLVTNNNIVIVIPDETPTLATDPVAATDSVVVITKYGTAVSSLLILPPPPIVDSISNEFAHTGEAITLWGRYFFFMEDVIFPGGISGLNIEAAQSGKLCKVTVPDGITTGGPIIPVSESGTGSIGIRGRFNDTTGMLINFEDQSIQCNGSNMQFLDGILYPDIPTVRGTYLLSFAMGVSPSSFWIPETVLETNCNPDVYTSKLTWPDYPLNTPARDLELRFEVYSRDPWTSGFMEMAFLVDGAWDKAHRYNFQPWNGAPGNIFDSYNIEKGWRTFAIPITSFVYTKSATELIKPLSYGDIYQEPFNYNFKNPTEGSMIDFLNVAFDNFRIVKIK